MFEVILYQPEIPPNTGNIIRLCANTGAGLHLVRPLGFDLDDARLRRAGLDYREYAEVLVHDDLASCLDRIRPPRVFAFSSHAAQPYDRVRYEPGDALLFGCETAGLPADVMADIPEGHRITIPMRATSRSLNLSNAVAVAVYEAWRQQGFA